MTHQHNTQLTFLDQLGVAADCQPIGLDVDPFSYDRIVVAFSGGKDSLACLLHLIKLGLRDRIELHHHDIDGMASHLMDWPCTVAYCRAIAAHFDLPFFVSFREGGFEREMNRNASATAPVRFETVSSTYADQTGLVTKTVGGNGPVGTRGLFPQVSADLKVRWCSAYLKIDVLAALLRNEERFLNSRTLVVTGERAEESPSRAKYKSFEPHRSDARKSPKLRRLIDQWRPVHAWTERDVWDLIKEFGIVPHPGYSLGFGRLSCMKCIFGNATQWSSVKMLDPNGFDKISYYERKFGKTIKRNKSIEDLANSAQPYPGTAEAPPSLVETAMGTVWVGPIAVSRDEWKLPAGAFGDNAGPS